ncbi:MAG: hypothetical protein ACYC7D_00805 [Nitrososphaerales archaeon]
MSYKVPSSIVFLMSAQKAKTKANRMYKSAKQNTKRMVHSDRAHQINAKARETMNNARNGAKRVMGSQDVSDKRNDVMRSTKEFLGAVYNTARRENSKADRTIRRAQNSPKNRTRS